MKDYENKTDFRRKKRRKQSKRHAIRKRINLFFLICVCAAILVPAFPFLRNAFLHNIMKQPTSLTISKGSKQKSDLSNVSTDGTVKNADETIWSLILINKWNYIPDNYQVELIQLSNGELVDKRIYPALQKMFDAARKDKVYPVVVSGYRTSEKQQSLMEEKINDYENEGYSAKEAKKKAEAWVAIPGTSEHQLGISVDINADGIHSIGNEVYEWLNQNAYKFGFINRYPSDKTEITGVINEPWHYRYVGIKAATEIQNQGVCLEEYLNRTN